MTVRERPRRGGPDGATEPEGARWLTHGGDRDRRRSQPRTPRPPRRGPESCAMAAPTPDGGMVLPSGAAGVPARGTLAAALGRVRGWWARCARPTPARLWESAADGTGAFRPGST